MNTPTQLIAKKNLLFISRHAPYGSSLAKEALDAILAASAYDQNLSLLFMDDGVFQLLHKQDSKELQQKNFSAMLPALPLYEINNIYAHSESLQARNILMNELCLDNLIILNNEAVSFLFEQQDQLLSF